MHQPGLRAQRRDGQAQDAPVDGGQPRDALRGPRSGCLDDQSTLLSARRRAVSLDAVSEELDARIEELVRRYGTIPARQMNALRDAGEVPLDLVRIGAIEHPNPMVRRVCLDILDHLDDASGLETFRQALRDDPVPRVRRHAIHALTCVKCSGRPIVGAALDDLAHCARDDPNARVRREAAAALRSARGGHRLRPPSQVILSV